MRICRQVSGESFGKRKLAFDGQFGQDFLFISKFFVKQGRGVAEPPDFDFPSGSVLRSFRRAGQSVSAAPSPLIFFP